MCCKLFCKLFVSVLQRLSPVNFRSVTFSEGGEDLELVVEEQSTCMKTQADAITALDARVSKLEDINAVNRAAIDTIRAATNSTEQYTRRESVRVSGLLAESSSSEAKIMRAIEDCHIAMNIPYAKEDIDRAHRVGRVFKSERDGKEYHPIIIKFRYFAAKKRFYEARPKGNRATRPPNKQFTVSVDLTKPNYDLLRQAREKTEDLDKVAFCFSDVNCHTGLRTSDGHVRMFSSPAQLDEVIEKL